MSKPWEKIKRIKELLVDIESEFDAEECNHAKTSRDLLFFEEENSKLQNQLKEAEELLKVYNHYLKNDNDIARTNGTTIDDYFTKYMNKEGEA